MNWSQFMAILRARRRLSLMVFGLTVATAVVLSLVLPKKYMAEASVVVDPAPDPVNGAVFGAMMGPAIIATQVDIIQSDRVARRVISNLKLDQNEDLRSQWKDEAADDGVDFGSWIVELLSKHLDVKPSRDGNVIAIDYNSASPKTAALLANAFAQAFLDVSVDLRIDPAKRYVAFFDARAKAVREQLQAAQTKLSRFQQDNGIIGSDERMDVETQRLNDLSTQLVLVQGMSTESRSRSAQAAGSGDSLNEALNNPVISNLKVDLGRAEANLQELNSRLGPNNPQVVQAKANISELRGRIDAETRRVTGGMGVNARIDNARVAGIQADLQAQRDKVLKLKKNRDEMAVLQRDVDNAQKAYDDTIMRLDQTSLESQSRQTNVNLLSQATPPTKPASPKLLLNTILSIFLGAMLAVGVALLRELRDRRVRGTQDLIDSLGVPMLGVLPRPAIKAVQSLMAQRIISGRLSAPAK